LTTWGSSFTAGDTAKSRAALGVARAIAGVLKATTGDALLLDAVAAIDHAIGQRSRSRLRALADGHRALADGIQLMNDRKLPEATERLRAARTLLTAGASPMNGFAAAFEGRVQLARLQYDAALGTLTSIRSVTPAAYLVLRSMASQFIGLVYDTRSD